MWGFRSERLPGDRGLRFAADFGPRPASFAEVVRAWQDDATFRAHTPETIGLEELGNQGWDPVCFATVEGFLYYMPAFARLVLEGCEEGRTSQGLPYNLWYLPQFLFHLREERIAAFDEPQRQTVLALLRHVLEEMPDDVEEWAEANRLLELIERMA